MRNLFKKAARHPRLQPRSFGRFFIVGCFNTFIGIISFPVLYWSLGTRLGVNMLLVMGWIVSMAFAFLTHKLFTFKSHGPYHRESSKFLLLGLVILGINMIVMNLVMGRTTIHPVLIQFIITTVLSITLMLINYFGMSRLIFKK
jgi:putative flippase GtrA